MATKIDAIDPAKVIADERAELHIEFVVNRSASEPIIKVRTSQPVSPSELAMICAKLIEQYLSVHLAAEARPVMPVKPVKSQLYVPVHN